MATKAWSLLRAARKASLASRAAAAAASRAAAAADVAADPAATTKASSLLRAVRRTSLASRAAAAAASRAARAADVAIDVALVDRVSLEDSIPRLPTSADYAHLPEDSKTPTAKDLESDDALWALYERWCKAFDKKRDYAAMTYRFEIFRHSAQSVYRWNNGVPANPKLAADLKRNRRKVKLLLSKGEDALHFDSVYHPAILGPLADGGDPFLHEWDYDLLKSVGKGDALRAPEDVTVE